MEAVNIKSPGGERGGRIWHGSGPRALVALLVAWAAVLGGCESLDVLGGGEEETLPEYREVVAVKAPFYDSSPSDSAIPFIYLTQGTQVEWLEDDDDDDHTRVQLANGDRGWVPSASLGTPNVPAPSAVPPNDENASAVRREESSAASHFEAGDESLDHFNVP